MEGTRINHLIPILRDSLWRSFQQKGEKTLNLVAWDNYRVSITEYEKALRSFQKLRQETEQRGCSAQADELNGLSPSSRSSPTALCQHSYSSILLWSLHMRVQNHAYCVRCFRVFVSCSACDKKCFLSPTSWLRSSCVDTGQRGFSWYSLPMVKSSPSFSLCPVWISSFS